MKVAILYICTGKYDIFWEDFYLSSKKYFLPKYEKQYYVFSDNTELVFKDNLDVAFSFQEKLGWPYDTLFRFKIFNAILSDLREYDYVFFFNANSLLIKEVGDEILDPNLPLIGALHPCYFNKANTDFIYDRNPKSLAFIKDGEGHNYYMGAFNGGTSKAYCKLISRLHKHIELDLKKDIIALWHDESHLNRYYLDHHESVKILPPSFVYPEEMTLPFDKINMLRDKKKLGGHDFLRGIEEKDKVNKKTKKSLVELVKSIFK